MYYTLHKFVYAVVTIPLILLGLAFIRSNDLAIGAALTLIPAAVLFTNWRKWSRFQKMTYQWYRASFPQHARADGVNCHACGGRHLHVRSLMQHTYHRAHFCAACGTTLYYSREK